MVYRFWLRERLVCTIPFDSKSRFLQPSIFVREESRTKAAAAKGFYPRQGVGTAVAEVLVEVNRCRCGALCSPL